MVPSVLHKGSGLSAHKAAWLPQPGTHRGVIPCREPGGGATALPATSLKPMAAPTQGTASKHSCPSLVSNTSSVSPLPGTHPLSCFRSSQPLASLEGSSVSRACVTLSVPRCASSGVRLDLTTLEPLCSSWPVSSAPPQQQLSQRPPHQSLF